MAPSLGYRTSNKHFPCFRQAADLPVPGLTGTNCDFIICLLEPNSAALHTATTPRAPLRAQLCWSLHRCMECGVHCTTSRATASFISMNSFPCLTRKIKSRPRTSLYLLHCKRGFHITPPTANQVWIKAHTALLKCRVERSSSLSSPASYITEFRDPQEIHHQLYFCSSLQ